MTNFRKGGGKMSITVDHFVCADTKLLINTDKPGKAPLEFDIGDLRMKEIGPGQPLRFEATLINPKPVGNIPSTGSFGPLNKESPRDSAVNGDYSFTQADLGTIKGIGGILSSTGKYAGTFGHIEVDGQTDTPDFQVAVSGHPVPLRRLSCDCRWHRRRHLPRAGQGHSPAFFIYPAGGKIVRMKEPLHGHDIELNVVLGHATIEDLLKLGVKTDPPIITGTVTMKTKPSLPPGPANVPTA